MFLVTLNSKNSIELLQKIQLQKILSTILLFLIEFNTLLKNGMIEF